MRDALRDRRRHWRELVIVVAVGLRVELALRRHGLEAVCEMVGVHLDLGVDETPEPTDRRLPSSARVSFWAVDQVMRRWPWGDTCLRRCLVLGQRIRRMDPVVRIGVRTTGDGSFAVHSWLQVNGRALDSGAGAFHPLKAGTAA